MSISKRKRSAFTFLFFIIICGHTWQAPADDSKEVPRIAVQDAEKLLGSHDTVIIDVRRFRNWWRSSKKILNAVREDPSQVNQWRHKYSRNKTLIFYCA